MRTTITLDEDVAARLDRLRRDEGRSFKELVNSTLRAGLDRNGVSSADRFVQSTSKLGLRPGIDLDRALAVAAQLEDEEIVAKLERRK